MKVNVIPSRAGTSRPPTPTPANVDAKRVTNAPEDVISTACGASFRTESVRKMLSACRTDATPPDDHAEDKGYHQSSG